MKCPQCNNETFIDHVIQQEQPEGIKVTYAYVCMNPMCGEYRKVSTLTGAEVEGAIQPNTAGNA